MPDLYEIPPAMLQAGFAAAGFFLGAGLVELIGQALLRRSPAVVEGELVVESEATVVEAERIIRRAR